MLTLNSDDRKLLWDRLFGQVERYIEGIDEHAVAGTDDVDAIRAWVSSYDFQKPLPAERTIDDVVDALWRHQVHTSHRRYYGLFNPNPTTMGIVADTIVAAFNPQLAAWSHNPVACEIEQHLVRAFGERFGYARDQVSGSFTSGGAEANHTALLAALNHQFPSYRDGGARALAGEPVLYVTAESHHSFAKAAMLCGIGKKSVMLVPTDERFRMDTAALSRQIVQDRDAGRLPFLIVATLGTTSAGLIDPIMEIADIGAREAIWVHADAAWGGAAMLVPELRPHLDGVGRADSITFDAHKWLSVPMGAGMFFTRHGGVLERIFAVDAGYMPVTRDRAVIEPHRQTMQWSRRFIGLKVFMSLLVAGWEGYEKTIRHQTDMGDYLRERLHDAHWRVVNDTPLPTVCFADARPGADNSIDRLSAIAALIVGTGRAWISTTQMGDSTPVLRACITNYRSDHADIDALVADLEWARSEGL